jgi:CrcB protein
MYIYLLIAAGGALGSVARHWLSNFITVRIDSPFPWGTFWVNVSGCLAIGFFATISGPAWKSLTSVEARLFLMTGICGGFTTFSAFSLQTLNLLRAGDWPRAAAYIVASVVVCLVSVWLGHFVATLFNQSS